MPNRADQSTIHVAMVILEYYPLVGGAQQQLRQLIPLLAAAGIRVTVLTRHQPGLLLSEHLDGSEIVRIPVSGSRISVSLRFTRGCLRWIRRHKPDIIHAYSFLSPLTIGVIAKHRWQIPLVVKVLRGGVLGDTQRLRRRFLFAQRLAIYKRTVDYFVEISQEIQQELDALGIGETKRLFIPNGVDVSRFKPALDKRGVRQKLNLPANTLIAIYAGRLAREKQIDRLLEVWRAFPEVTLLILGEGPEEKKLRAIAGPNVDFRGRQEDVKPFLQAADIFILPSTTEGLSNALLEGMATGLAPVATNVGGAPDIIEHGVTGLLVSKDRPEDLANTLDQVIQDSDLRRRLGSAARAVMVNAYSLQQIATRYVKLYRSLA